MDISPYDLPMATPAAEGSELLKDKLRSYGLAHQDAKSPIAKGAPAGRALHHVIPQSLLWAVRDRLYIQWVESQYPEAQVALRQFLSLSSRLDRRANHDPVEAGQDPLRVDVEGLIDRMRSEKLTTGRRPEKLNDVGVEHLDSAAIWPRCNLVEGPKERSDNPKKDEFDHFMYGLNLREQNRMRALKALYVAYQQFVVEAFPSRNKLRVLAEEIRLFKSLVNLDEYVAFRFDMWIKDKDGTWRKRRHEDNSS